MSTANATHYFSVGQPEFWPSVAEYLVYDEILYQAMTRDTYRKSAYKKALLQCARNQVVVDIGTGPNALLATMALEIGAQRVYAIEYKEPPLFERHFDPGVSVADMIAASARRRSR